MSAPFRIRRPDVGATPVALTPDEGFRFYLDRLLKMIPAEVVSLYLVGSGIIPKDQVTALAVWFVVRWLACLSSAFTAPPTRPKTCPPIGPTSLSRPLPL
jgi:hypothetical protein